MDRAIRRSRRASRPRDSAEAIRFPSRAERRRRRSRSARAAPTSRSRPRSIRARRMRAPSLYVADAKTGTLKHLLTAQSRFATRWLDANTLAYEDGDGAIRLWDATTGREVGEARQQAGHRARRAVAGRRAAVQAGAARDRARRLGRRTAAARSRKRNRPRHGAEPVELPWIHRNVHVHVSPNDPWLERTCSPRISPGDLGRTVARGLVRRGSAEVPDAVPCTWHVYVRTCTCTRVDSRGLSNYLRIEP